MDKYIDTVRPIGGANPDRLAFFDQKRRTEEALAQLATMTCGLCGTTVTGYEEAAAHDEAKHPEMR
jgi:hypothetical protein